MHQVRISLWVSCKTGAAEFIFLGGGVTSLNIVGVTCSIKRDDTGEARGGGFELPGTLVWGERKLQDMMR